VIINEYKQEMASAKQHLRQSMVVSLSDKPTSTDVKNSEDKEKFEPVCAKVEYQHFHGRFAGCDCL